MTLKASKTLQIRFNEVDSMNVVWHGNYAAYFEDAREAFGEKYGLGYMTIFSHGLLAPLVELTFQYKKPIIYGMKPFIEIEFHPCAAAKLIFTYTISDAQGGSVLATGRSVQVFTTLNHELVWDTPPFIRKWKEQHNLNPSF